MAFGPHFCTAVPKPGLSSHVSYSLDSSNGGYEEDYRGEYYKSYEGGY